MEKAGNDFCDKPWRRRLFSGIRAGQCVKLVANESHSQDHWSFYIPYEWHGNSILDSQGQLLFGGSRPQDLLASAPERVFEAAMDEVQELAHS